MANPTGYTVSYSFAGFQANSPTTPLPGSRIDNEFAGIATSVASLISALADVRRSDGALKNGIVTFDSFAPGVQLTIDPTNGEFVAAAVATTEANAALTDADRIAAAASAVAAAISAAAAEASAGSVNLSLYLAKANNLAGLGSLETSRSNLGLGTAAVLDVGTAANQIVRLDGAAKLPALDGSQLTNILTGEPGSIQWFPFNAAPSGFLKANGALVSRVTYARLYTAAAASGNIVSEASWAANAGGFSTGDLSTTFRLPDLRGEFIRGWDNARGVDSGRTIGSTQADAFKSHTHGYSDASGGQHGGTGVSGGELNGTLQTGAPSTGSGTETRPRNVALLACIKI